jgi:hypothetical protein
MAPGSINGPPGCAGSSHGAFRMSRHSPQFGFDRGDRGDQDCVEILYRRLGQCGEHAARIRLRHRRQGGGVDAVRAHEVDQSLQVVLPALDAQAAGHRHQRPQLRAVTHSIDRLGEQHRRLLLAQHLLLGRELGLEGEAQQQLAAHAVDRADARLVELGRDGERTMRHEKAAGALAQLGRGLHREGRGDHTRCPYRLAREPPVQNLGQTIGLAAAGPGADKGDLHAPASQPARWTKSL